MFFRLQPWLRYQPVHGNRSTYRFLHAQYFGKEFEISENQLITQQTFVYRFIANWVHSPTVVRCSDFFHSHCTVPSFTFVFVSWRQYRLMLTVRAKCACLSIVCFSHWVWIGFFFLMSFHSSPAWFRVNLFHLPVSSSIQNGWKQQQQQTAPNQIRTNNDNRKTGVCGELGVIGRIPLRLVRRGVMGDGELN